MNEGTGEFSHRILKRRIILHHNEEQSGDEKK
jgi:hypothetical protein